MNEDLSLIFKALEFAARKHRDQRRKDAQATPYINHPIELAELLINEGNVSDIDVLVAAILHDTVEDTETTGQELESLFGSKIASIVLEVTDDKDLPKIKRKQMQIENAACCSDQAKLVKLADKICNLRDLHSSPPVSWQLERVTGYYDWAQEVISRVRGIHPVLEEIFDNEYKKRPVKS